MTRRGMRQRHSPPHRRVAVAVTAVVLVLADLPADIPTRVAARVRRIERRAGGGRLRRRLA